RAPESSSPHSVEGIVVRASETTRDPRLNPLDLRGRVHVLHFRVVDERDNDVPDATCAYRRAGTQDFIRPTTSSSGRAEEADRVVTMYPAIDVEVSAPGRRTVRLYAVDSDRTVVLALAPRVRISLPGGLPQLAPDTALGVLVAPATTRSFDFNSELATFDA